MTTGTKKNLGLVGLGFWLALPVFLLIQPATYFDTGSTKCLSVLLFNKTCIGCGLTRSFQHAIHLNFQKAWEYNPLFVILLPIGMMVYIHVAGRLIGKNYFGFMRKWY